MQVTSNPESPPEYETEQAQPNILGHWTEHAQPEMLSGTSNWAQSCPNLWSEANHYFCKLKPGA